MTATNMCSDFDGFKCASPLSLLSRNMCIIVIIIIIIIIIILL